MRLLGYSSLWCMLMAGVVPSAAAQLSDTAFPLQLVEESERFGTALEREELAGQVVLLDFWASWCAPCLQDIPVLRSIYEEFAGQGLVVVGVNVDTFERRTLLSFLRRHDMSWSQVHEPDFSGDLCRAFQVEVLPRTVLIDAEGQLVGVDLRGGTLRAAIEGLLVDPR